MKTLKTMSFSSMWYEQQVFEEEMYIMFFPIHGDTLDRQQTE